MLTKPRDELYCNIDKSHLNMHPDFNQDRLKLLHKYITERYDIHIKKDVLKLEPPYTTDEVLKTYKFTNIRREHDRTTEWLIENISTNSEISYKDKIYKSIIFRLYNRIETADLIHLDDIDFFTSSYFSDHTETWIDKCRVQFNKARKNYRVTTNAYKVGGTTRGLEISYPREKCKPVRVLLLVNDLIKDDFADKLDECHNQLEAFELIRSIKGIGNFIAYQIYVDLTYIEEFPFSENEFTISGPGCHYGLQMLLKENSDTNKIMSDEEILFWMRDNLESEFNSLDLYWNPQKIFIDLEYHDRCFNVMSLENIMCEFQKYVRANDPNQSKPRNRWKGFKYENPFEED